jgi:hypothetical protein
MFLLGLVYCSALVLGNLFVYEQQSKILKTNLEKRQSTELNMLAELTHEGLITQNYAFIEWVVNRWGNEHRAIASLSLVNGRGQELFGYQSKLPAQAEVLTSQKRIAMYDDSYLLKIGRDTVEIENQREELLLQLLMISTGATMLLTLLLWVVFYRYAAQPMNEEIRLRKKAEEKLAALQAAD